MLFNSAAVQQLFNSLAVQQRRPHWVQTLRHSLVVQALPKASQNSSTYGHFWLYTSTDSIWFFFVFFCTLTRISALPGSYFYAFKPLVRRRNQECRFVQPRLCWDFVTVRVNNWNDGTIWEFNKPRVNFTPPRRSLLKMPTRYCKQNVKTMRTIRERSKKQRVPIFITLRTAMWSKWTWFPFEDLLQHWGKSWLT